MFLTISLMYMTNNRGPNTEPWGTPEGTSVEDCIILQNDLDIFLSYSSSHFLPVNYSKCKILSITNKSMQIMFNYSLSNSLITRVETHYDLGVFFNSKLTFENHISNMCSKALKSLGFIIRCSRNFKDIGCMRVLYFGYVRSKLEYASIVWSPFTQFC